MVLEQRVEGVKELAMQVSWEKVYLRPKVEVGHSKKFSFHCE